MKTKEIETILFPTDFSDVSMHSLKSAMELTKKANAKLILLNVVDTPFNFNSENEPVEMDLILQDLIHFSETKLKSLKDIIQTKYKLTVETASYTGETIPSITRAVNHFNVDLIVMGTKVTKDLFFKSSSFNIVKNTAIPLLTVSMDGKTNGFKNILFPFNEQFMTLKKADDVLQLAKLFKSKIILLGISSANTLEKRQLITNNLMFIKSICDGYKIPCEVHFKHSSDYSHSILEYCNENEIDLVTIANNLPTSLKETLASLTAKTVINHSQIPVLTVPVRN